MESKQLEELVKSIDSQIKSIDSQIGNLGNGTSSVVQTQTKQPLDTLNFKRLLERPVLAFAIFDEKYYVIDENANIQVYDDVVNDQTPSETGVQIDVGQQRNIIRLAVTSKGLAITVNNLEDNSAEIYYSPDIHTNFTQTYKSPVDENRHHFTSSFGMSVEENGLVFIGVYGRGASQKDLLLSTNGGETFEVVERSRVIEPVPNNSHWHDVEIDANHGYLWASQGDGQASNRIIYSSDLGKSWEHLIDDSESEQPTAIMSFPNRVIFGRDGKTTGLDSVIKPKLLSDTMNFKPHHEINEKVGVEYYVHSPVKKGAEGYFGFSIDPEENPVMIWGTGDFGESFHSVFIADRNEGDFVNALVGIDENYIFGLGANHGGGLNTIYYSKKADWQ